MSHYRLTPHSRKSLVFFCRNLYSPITSILSHPNPTLMKLSARNKLKGTVVSVEEGLITGKVKIDLGNGNVVTSIISREAIEDLQLKVGDVAYAVIKSTEIMIGKD